MSMQKNPPALSRGHIDDAGKNHSVNTEVGVYDNFRHYGICMPVGIEVIVAVSVFGFHFQLARCIERSSR